MCYRAAFTNFRISSNFQTKSLYAAPPAFGCRVMGTRSHDLEAARNRPALLEVVAPSSLEYPCTVYRVHSSHPRRVPYTSTVIAPQSMGVPLQPLTSTKLAVEAERSTLRSAYLGKAFQVRTLACIVNSLVPVSLQKRLRLPRYLSQTVVCPWETSV